MAEIFYCSFHTSMMFKEIRFQKIQEIIHNDGEAKVEELAEKFSVSEMTIRRDLNTMVQKGLIERTHGGSVLAKDRNLLLRRPKPRFTTYSD